MAADFRLPRGQLDNSSQYHFSKTMEKRAASHLMLVLFLWGCGRSNIRIFILLAALGFAQANHCARGSEPEIIGSIRFSNQVQSALLLLKTRDADAHAIVTNYIGRIQEGERSGMWAYKKPPSYEMSDTNAFYSLTWCAATIAHDSFHSKLYHDCQLKQPGRVPDAVWTGRAAEQLCMKHQLSVMERIGATKWEMDYAKKQAGGHYVKDKETWREYKKRSW